MLTRAVEAALIPPHLLPQLLRMLPMAARGTPGDAAAGPFVRLAAVSVGCVGSAPPFFALRWRRLCWCCCGSAGGGCGSELRIGGGLGGGRTSRLPGPNSLISDGGMSHTWGTHEGSHAPGGANSL